MSRRRSLSSPAGMAIPGHDPPVLFIPLSTDCSGWPATIFADDLVRDEGVDWERRPEVTRCSDKKYVESKIGGQIPVTHSLVWEVRQTDDGTTEVCLKMKIYPTEEKESQREWGIVLQPEKMYITVAKAWPRDRNELMVDTAHKLDKVDTAMFRFVMAHLLASECDCITLHLVPWKNSFNFGVSSRWENAVETVARLAEKMLEADGFRVQMRRPVDLSWH